MKRLDFLSLKMDSFDIDTFTREALSYSENSMLFYFDFDEMRVEHKPDYIRWFPSRIKFPWPKNMFLKMTFMPVWWLVFFSTFMLVFGYLCLRYRPKVCWTEVTWVGMVFGLAKKIGLCEHFIYCTGDWLAKQENRGFLSRLANDYLFVYTDYIAAINCDLLVSYSIKCGQARYDYWGRKLAEKNFDRYPPPIEICEKAVSHKATEICFLGNVRDDSGLDQMIPLLGDLNKKYGIRLKIIGPQSPYRDQVEKQITELGFDHLVDFFSWIPLEEVQDAMQNSFCGVNLLVNHSTYALYAVPGKVIQYLQSQVPPLLTDNTGVSAVIREQQLGVVISPNLENLESTIIELFENQSKYRKNIRNYASRYPNKSIREYLSMSQASQKEENIQLCDQVSPEKINSRV